MIELQNITKSFGAVRALDAVSLKVMPGERLALVGENGAGKSSLMNVLFGLYRPDSGEVRFDGAACQLRSPADAMARGIGMVHQHFTLVPTLSVAENVVLGAEPTRRGLLDVRRLAEHVEVTCRRLGFRLDPLTRVDTLTVGSQQKVEIVKALHRGATTLILDEPTAVLTPQEADELFEVTGALSQTGTTVVLISHKLKEVLNFATRIAVLRRGKKVAEVAPQEASPADLARLMVGEGERSAQGPSPALTEMRQAPADSSSTTVLEVDHLRAGKLKDVSFRLKAGEILGVAGVDGNGQRELAQVLTGLLPYEGQLEFLGRSLKAFTPAQAHDWGIAHIPEDRLRHGLVSDLSVEENASLGQHDRPPFAWGPFIDFRGRRREAAALLRANDVRPAEPELRAGALSGGNQQKLVVGRALSSVPKMLVVVQPTRGLDIAAVAAVHRKLEATRDRGCGVLLVSLDLDELLALSNRLLVVYEGRVTALLDRAQFDERLIGRRMLGVLDA